MAMDSQSKDLQICTIERRGTEDSMRSSAPSLKSPRSARFTEETDIISPIEPSERSRAPWSNQQHSDSSVHLAPQPQPADVGFGYIGNRASDHLNTTVVDMPLTPRSPLKSALKSPGAPPRQIPDQNPLSPTWMEEDLLEREEEKTEVQQQKDVRVKARVRLAKIFLRATNFSCSLIVLSMMSSTFVIFNTTKELPTRNNLPPWASNTRKWPAILMLVSACISLFLTVIILYANCRRQRKRAEKAAVYYTIFAMGFFVFSTVMWLVSAVALDSAKANSNGNDLWGWSCKDNARKQVFKDVVNYDLVCRLQNWGLVCALIEVVVELISILIYATIFYRFFSKRALRKSMAKRDTARSDLYLAQLRSQSAPNTPGLRGPLSPSEGGYNPMFSPRFGHFGGGEEKSANANIDEISAAEEGVRYVNAPVHASAPKEFKLAAAPPKRNTPKLNQSGFSTPTSQPYTPTEVPPPMPLSPASVAPAESEAVHHPAAPGEEQYDSVPIPGAYSSPIHSPTHPPNTAMGEFFQPL